MNPTSSPWTLLPPYKQALIQPFLDFYHLHQQDYPSLLNVMDQAQMYTAWHRSLVASTLHDQYLQAAKPIILQRRVLHQWQGVKQSKQFLRAVVYNWWIKRREQKWACQRQVIAQWQKVVHQGRENQRHYMIHWRYVAHRQTMMRSILNNVTNKAIHQVEQRQLEIIRFIQDRWKWKRLRRFEKVRFLCVVWRARTQYHSPHLPHRGLLELQIDKFAIHLFIRILFPCMLHLGLKSRSSIFVTQADQLTKWLIAIAQYRSTYETCYRLLPQIVASPCFASADSVIRLLHTEGHFRSMAQVWQTLHQMLKRFWKGMKHWSTLLLPSLLEEEMNKVIHFQHKLPVWMLDQWRDKHDAPSFIGCISCEQIDAPVQEWLLTTDHPISLFGWLEIVGGIKDLPKSKMSEFPKIHDLIQKQQAGNSKLSRTGKEWW
jgi:hypothetical protein